MRRAGVLSRFPHPNPTIRLRLTLLYGSLFLASGLLVLGVSYTLLRQSLNDHVQSSKPYTNTVSIESDGSTSVQTSEGGEVQPLEPIEDATFTDGRSFEQVFDDFGQDVSQKVLNQLVVQSAIGIGLIGVFAFGGGWIVAGRVLRPVRQITNAARYASDSNLHARVNLNGPRDELKDLADTFDHMLGRLEVAFESQRRFAAEASHELRTPISIVQAEADVALAMPDASLRERRLAEAVGAAAARGERLIASLLALARSQSTLIDHTTIDLAGIVGDVVSDLSRKADRLRIALELTLDDAVVEGDRMLLERLTINLVENALVHNVRDGWVRVQVSTIDDRVRLVVENSGRRIDTADVETLFEPFHRHDNDQPDTPPGVGLGLAIVQSIVSSHNGSITATPRQQGGLDVVVTLPAISSTTYESTSSNERRPRRSSQ